MTRYLLDTNIFVKAKNEMPHDIYISFWKMIAQLANEGVICSSVKVKDEINKGNDILKDWCKDNLSKDFYVDVDGETMDEYIKTIRWASSSTIYSDAAKQEYAMSNIADAFLVATASAKDMILVTNEIADPNCKKRVKIPDACKVLGVQYCQLNDMFRNLGVII